MMSFLAHTCAAVRLSAIALAITVISPLSATVLPAPTVTNSSPGYQGIYLGSNAVGQGLSEFLSEQGTNTFLEFDFGSARTVDGFVNVTLNLAERSIGANRLIFDTDGTVGFNAATDTVVNFTQAQTGAQGQAFINRFRPVTAQRVRWEVQAVVGSPSLVGTTEISFLSTNAATVPITGVTVIGSATEFSPQFARANAANGIAGIGNVAGVEYASAGLGAGAFVDFDLGSVQAITGFDMFDRVFAQDRVTGFDLIFSNNADMSSPVATRSYSKASSWTASDTFTTPISARYVRWDATSGSGNTGLGDIQFYASEFSGVNLGAIVNGSPREVTFTVSGKIGVVNDVTVEWTFNPSQVNANEAWVELFAPDGTICDVFRAGTVDDTDIAGPYVFNDAYTTMLSNAVISTASGTAAAGNYRPDYGLAPRSFRTTFGGKNPNGIWKLRLQDILAGNTPSISSANLSIRTAPAPPAVTSLSPNVMLLAGGSTTITGTGFSGTPMVTIGGVVATNVMLVNATTLTCTVPVGTAGARNVVVSNENGSGTLVDGFRYTNLVVTSTADSGAGTLREALSDAQSLAGANTITFAAALSGQTITLSTFPIAGSGYTTDDTAGVTVDASALSSGITLTRSTANSRIFYLRTGALTLKNLTIANAGGSIPGGGIFSSGTLLMERCTLNNNTGRFNNGGALYTNGNATVVQCTFTGNNAGNGGGIHSNGALTVRHCTIVGNTGGNGGGIALEQGMTLENSIVANNTATVAGIDIFNGPTLTRVGANIVPILHTQNGLAGSGTISTSNPLLGTFAGNGGATQTFPLQAGSPAINAAVGSSITSDQRGLPIVSVADIGAFEAQVIPPSVTTPTSSAVASTTATLGGDLTNHGNATITERGVVFSITSTNNNPLINGSGVVKLAASGTGTGAFTVNVTGLIAGSAYSFKAYAINSQGTSYSSVGSFSTPSVPPEIHVVPTGPQNLGLQRMGVASAPRTFTIANQGNGALSVTSVTTTGDKAADFIVNTSGMLGSVPALSSTTFTVVFNPTGTGDRATTLRILSSDADEGTIDIALSGVGSDSDPPTVTDPAGGVPLATTVTLGGTVASQGALSERGVVVSLTSANANPFIGGTGVQKFVASGLSVGAFTVTATELTGGSAYTFKAYATNTGGTSYSSSATFTTPSNDANLNALTVSTGVLSPAFASGTVAYMLTVPNATTTLSLTPTRAHPQATILVGGGSGAFTPVTSGVASAALPLSVGENALRVRVTAQDASTKDYDLLVTRQSSINAALSALTLSAGTLSPAFAGATLSYTVSLPHAAASLTVTATVAQADATLTVNGNALTSASESADLPINYGANTITVLVTAQDTSVTRPYTLTVTRAEPPNTAPSFVIPTATGSVLSAAWIQRLTDAQRTWTGIAMSADGQRIAACAAQGSLWTSTDAGLTWTERSAAGKRGWNGICSSADGTKLSAIAASGRVWTSADSGVTWTARTGVPVGDWGTISCDSTGLKLFASNHSFGGLGYTSVNQGAAWTARSNIARSLISASSADGNRLAAFVTGGSLQVSSNGGTAWTATSFAQPGVQDLAMSADGTRIFGAVFNQGDTGRIHVSSNGGTSFTQVGPDIGFRAITCSSDGTRVTALAGGDGSIYVSQDSGMTWAKAPAKPTGPAGRLRMAGDGSRLVAAGAVLHTSIGSTSSTQMAQMGDGTQTVTGFVAAISPGTGSREAEQTVSFNVTNTNNALFSVQPAIAADGTLTYTPAATGSGGTASVSIVAQDNGGTANGGVNVSAAQTFTITLTPPANLDLASLSLSAGTLTPAFTASLNDYAAMVSDTTASITLTPTLADTAMRLSVNGSSLASGAASPSIALNHGLNQVVIIISNATGTRSKGYIISVTRSPVLASGLQPGVGIVTATTATLTGELSTDGGSTITERGFVYALTSANANPEIGGGGVTQVISSLSSFSADIAELNEDSDYSFKAYAINAVGTAYSAVRTFRTLIVTRPLIATVSPVASLIAGGDGVGLTGRYFTGTTSVTVGGVAATNVNVLSDTTLTFNAPTGTLGEKDLVVTTSIGSTTVRNAYRYVDLTVTSISDTGAGSLREALRHAADVSGPNVITFAPALSGQTIACNPIPFAGTGNDNAFVMNDVAGVTIDGSGLVNGITLTKANPNVPCRLIFLRGGALTLRGLTLQNAGGGIPGGAIYTAGTLTLERCTLNNNSAHNGGAVYNDNGTLTVMQSTLTRNRADNGGAIWNDGTLIVRHSTLAGNSATSIGGIGGGIAMAKAMTLENSIVAGNTASQGLDIYNNAALTRVGASIVPILHTNNGVTGSGVLLTSDPSLIGLNANGGPTRTMGLQAGSPAINTAVGSGITSDQRGQALTGAADIGAFELPASLPILGVSGAGNVQGNSVALNGLVSSNGGVNLTQRGFVYALTSSNPIPELGNGTQLIAGGTGVGSFVANATGLAPGASYSVRAYATNSVGPAYSPVLTFTTLSNNANLSALTLSSGTLSPAFAANTLSYTASVAHEVNSLTLGSTVAQSDAKARVNGGAPGTSATVALNVGSSNTINVVVTAQDNSATKTYTVTVTRAAGLPMLARAQRAATTATGSTVRGVITNSGGAGISARGIVVSLASVNNNPELSGTGVTAFSATTVIANEFTASASPLTPNSRYALRSYATNSAGTGYSEAETFDTLSANADLSAIALSAGTLAPSFTAGNLAYTANVDATELSITPTVAEAGISVRINNELVVSGVSSRPIPLGAGNTTVNLVTTSRDGSSTKTYTLTVARAPRAPLLASATTRAAVLSTTATLGGTITANNGANITERGIVYALTSVNSNPLFNGTGVTKVIGAGTDTGVFSVPVTALLATSNYSFKAYATNSAGTGFSEVSTLATGTGAANLIPSFILPPGGVVPAGVNWTQLAQRFGAVDCSNDGSRVLAGLDGVLGTSTNAGVSFTGRPAWIRTRPAPVNAISLAMSDNGNNFFASSFSLSTFLVVSGNGGASVGQSLLWTSENRRPIVALNEAGTRAFLVTGTQFSDSIYVQGTGGGWVAKDSVRAWKAIACSGDGLKAVAGTNTELYTSENGGDTWALRQGFGQQNWSSLAYSKDGTVILGATVNGALWISHDSGKGWFSRLATPGRDWRAVDCSADGKVMAAATAGGGAGKIWVSANKGDTWEEQANSPATDWSGLAMSGDGLTIYAGGTAGGYKSVGGPAPTTIEVLPGAGPQTIAAFAKNISAGANERNQTVNFLLTTDNDALFRTLPSISRDGTLSFAPGITVGQATVTVRLQDDGGTSGGGVDTSVAQTFIVKLRGDDSRGTWSTAAWTDDASSGVVSGRTVWARHFGSTTPATVNGVTVPGITNMAGNNKDFDLNSPFQLGDINTLTSAGGGSAVMASSFFWGGNPTNIQLKGLGVGTEYVLTLLTVGFDASGHRVLHLGSGSDAIQVDQSQFGNNNGLRIEYNFTANKATRDITIARANNNEAGFHVYGLALRFAGSTLNTQPSNITLDVNSTPENGKPNTIVGYLATTDPDILLGQSHIYTLVSGLGSADNGQFVIKGNALALTQSADFEARSSYSVRIASTDNGYPGLSTEMTFMINITNVDEPATDITLSPNRMDENFGPYSKITQGPFVQDFRTAIEVGTITVLGDPDDVGGISIVAQDGTPVNPSDLFDWIQISPRSFKLCIPGWKDFERKNEYKLRVRAGSGAVSIEKDFVFYINDKPDAPVITGLTNQVLNEDTDSAALSFTLADQDAGDLERMTLTATSSNAALFAPAGMVLGGTDSARTIRLTPLPNAFGTAVITITAADRVFSTSQNFTVTVHEVDDVMSFDIPETISAGAINWQTVQNVVSNLTAGPNEDGPSLGRTFNWAVTVSKPSIFLSIPVYKPGFFNWLELRAANSSIKETVTLTLTATELRFGVAVSSFSRTCALTISSNNAPTDITLSNTRTDENVTNLDIATLTTTDLDPADAGKHTYTFVNWFGRFEPTANGFFEIDNVAKKLKWKAKPDFETASSYRIRLKTTDSASPAASFEKTFIITLADLNEPAADITFGRGADENAGQGAVAATLGAVDPERGQTHVFSLVSGAGATHNDTVKLEVPSATKPGYRLIAKDSYNFEATPMLSFRISVTDNGTPPQTLVKEVKVPVIDRNDRPTRPVFTFTGLPEGNHDGNYAPNKAPVQIGTLSSTDEDGTPVGYFISWNTRAPGLDNGLFYVEDKTNKVFFRGIADFESPKKKLTFLAYATGSDKLRNGWTDDGGTGIRRNEAKITVDVTPVDEPPQFDFYVATGQTPGAKLLDVFYAAQDIDSPTMTVGMEFSPDGGATWRPCASVSGNVGTVPGNLWADREDARDDLHPLRGTFTTLERPPWSYWRNGYQVSTDRHIVWNVGKDWDQQYTTQGRVRLTVVSPNGARSSVTSGDFTLDTRYDGPLTVAGIVTNKLRNLGWPDVAVQIGTRTGKSDANGYYVITNAAPGKLITSHPNFCPVEIDVAAPARGQGVAMPTLPLTPNTKPPVVNLATLTAGKSPAFLSEVPIYSKVQANVSWNTNGIFAFPHLFQVDVSANGNKLDTYSNQTSSNFLSEKTYSLANIFTPSMTAGSNRIGVQAKNDLGLTSNLEELKVSYLPLHPFIKIFQPQSTFVNPNGFQSYSSNHFGFNFGSTDLNYTIENRIIGKWGIVFGTTGSFDYTINDANWELAYRGGDQNLFGNQTKSHKFFTRPKEKVEEEAAKAKTWLGQFNNKLFVALPDDDDAGRIALFMGDDVREIAFFARAIGTLDPTVGWALPDAEGALTLRKYGIIKEIGVLDSIPGLQPVAELFDITLTLEGGTELGGSARFAPKKGAALLKDTLSYRLKDATVSGALEIRAKLGVDAKLMGAEVWVGGRGYARLGYPAPLIREVDLRIQAGYEWWIGFVDDEGEITLGHFNYAAKDDPNAPKAPPPDVATSALAGMFAAPASAMKSQDGANLSLPPLVVLNSRSRGMGPMTRRWRQYGGESFELADVASPSTIKQAERASANHGNFTAAAAKSLDLTGVPELRAFNQLGTKPNTGDFQISAIPSDPVPTQAVLPLISNVFPRSHPVMAEKDGNIMLVYVRDTGAAAAYQFAEVAFTYYNGTSWTVPGPIAPDARAQMSPQVSFDGNGNAVAVWSRIKDAKWDGFGLLEGQNALIEIVSATWNAGTGAWSIPVAITENNVLDHKVTLSGTLSDGDLMLTWVSNAGNEVFGTAIAPDAIFSARWDAAAAAWGPGAQVVAGIIGIAHTDFAASGEKAVFAWSQKMTDADNSTDELWSMTWTSGTWAAPVRVTHDAVRDTDVKLAISPQGDVYAIWLRDEDLVMQKNFSGDPSLVRSKDLPGSPDNFALAMGPQNQLMALWSSTFNDRNPDVAYRLYTPSADSWSADVRLSNDAEKEGFLEPILDAQGNLLIAYLNTELEEVSVETQNADGTTTVVDGALRPGRTDLLLARRRMVTDLSLQEYSLQATADSWGPGGVITLQVTAINSGDKPVQNAAVSFFDGNPDAGGTLIGTVTIPGEFQGGESSVATLNWTMPADSEVQHNVFAIIDAQNSVEENDETNNRLTSRVGGADLHLEYIGSDAFSDGSGNARVRITNVGSPTSAPTDVFVWDSPARGESPVARVAVPALKPLANMELLIPFAAGTVGSSGRRELEMVANELMMDSEPDQANNRAIFALSGTRPLSSVTGLSDLAVTGSTLSPTFTTSTLGYKATVSSDVTAITVVPTVLDPFSSIKVNGSTVISGTLSQVLTLNSGRTQIVIDVTSEDGSKTLTYTVDVLRSITNLANNGSGSLRGMIADAALAGGPDVVAIPASMSGQTLRLSSAISISDPNGVVIDGSALPKGLVIEGNGNHRLFEVAAGSKLTLICVTLKDGGGASFASNGGAILNNGTLRIERCTVLENQAASGGAVHNSSTGTLEVVQSTFTQNTATAGAAIFNEGAASLTFSTLVESGISAVRSTGTLTVENSIIVGALNSTGSSSLGYRGHNCIRTSLGIAASGPAPITTDALLSDLGDFGGPTLTFVPTVGSPAVDQALAIATTLPTIDQRGLPRQTGINPDIGAVEGRVLIVTTAQDEFDPAGVTGAGYSLREAVRDAEQGATILFDRAVFNGSSATANTLILTRGPLAPRTVVTLDGTQNPGGINIITSISIATHPIARRVESGGSVRFTIAANAVSGGVFYQWRKDGVNIPNALGASLSISPAGRADEGVYDVVLTEGSSSGEILITNVTMEPAMTLSQPASLTVGTPAVTIMRHPVDALLPLGASHTLSVVVIAPATPILTYQWMLNGKPVAKATSPNLSFISATLLNAGAYTCVVKSGVSAVTSSVAQVAVVDNRSKTVNLLVGGTFTPKVSAAGNNLTFFWRRGTAALASTADTFTVSSLTLADAGLYTCVLTAPGGVITDGFNTTLNVNNRAPTLGPITLPNAFIGQSYYYKLAVLPIAGASATGFSVTGALPAGITLNTNTGVLSGRPTATKIGGYALSFTASNGATLKSAARNATLIVNAIDARALGVFAGPAPRSPLNGNLGGRFDLTTNPTGTFSGSVTLGARAKISFANMLLQVGDAGDQVLTGNITGITMADTAKTPLAALVEVFVADQTARLTLTHPNGTQLVIPAWRNPWSKTSLATAYATNYTLRLDAGQGDETSPDGYGFASFSIGADGIVKLSGKLPDGNAVTAGGFVGARGQVLVFQTLYKNVGSLVGQFDITRAVPVTTNSLVGTLTWSKPRVTTDLLYKDGFAPIAVQVVGSAYVRPAAGQRLLGLPATSDNALLDFRLGGLSASWSQLISIANPSPTGLNNTASVPPTAANSLKVAKLDAATGTFSGSFTLAGATALLNRPATFEGMIVNVGAVTQGYGFFLLPKVPVGTEKVTTAPRLSGVVELGAP